MQLFKSLTLRLVLLLLFGALFSARGIADPLDPMSFTSLGAFPTLAGTYTLNTNDPPTLTDPLGNTITGIVYTTPGGQQIAVFTFDSITVDSMTIFASGSLPVALLSQDFVTISGSGVIYANGFGGYSGSDGGPGGAAGGGARQWGSGPGGGGYGSDPGNFQSGGGGGFGGAGGGYYSGGPGSAYGDLTTQLQGGSGGGGSYWGVGGGGGGGGGGVEIGAVNAVSISGTVNVDGGSVGYYGPSSGGGSGGGLIVHGATVQLTGQLSAAGGEVAPLYAGGGGGGRVYVQTQFFNYGGAINVAGGNGGYDADGNPGVITLSAAQINHAPTANTGDGQTVTAVHTGNPANDTASVTLDGSASIDPDGDSLTYAWDDGQGHAATGVQPTFTLHPGSYTFTLTVTDPDGLSNSASVSVTVNLAPNAAPIANNMSVTLNQGASTNITLDVVDPDGDNLVVYVSNPAYGTLSFQPDGNAVYTPNAGYYGPDSFNFFAIDPYGAVSNTATVSLTVNQVINPLLSSLSPASANAGGPAFFLSAKGSNFTNGATLVWNGSPLTTTFVSATKLIALVPAADIASPGTAHVTVVTPSPGGGTSAARPFKILATTLKLASATLTKDSLTGVYTATLTLKNVGFNTASNVTLTKSSLGAANTSATLPVTVGDIAAGATGAASLTYSASAGASGTKVTLKVAGKFSGGTFSGSLKVTLPQ